RAGARRRRVRQADGLLQERELARGARNRAHRTRCLRSVPAYRAPGYPELAPDLAGDARVPERRAALGESCAPAQTNESPVPPILYRADDGLGRNARIGAAPRAIVCTWCALKLLQFGDSGSSSIGMRFFE